jgi:hypothetical protein
MPRSVLGSRRWEGNVVSIHVAPEASAAMQPITEVRAFPGCGLEGDRYFAGTGFYSKTCSQDETSIADGKVAGDEISFSAERPFGSFTYKGKVSGNEIKFQVTFNDQTFEITAKRVSS